MIVVKMNSGMIPRKLSNLKMLYSNQIFRKLLLILNREISKKVGITSIVVICTIALLINNGIYAQNSNTSGNPDNSTNENQITLSKVATANTVIANKTVFVGGFDTDYSITGTTMNIKDTKDLIISSIIDDYTKSPTVGYVTVSKSMSNSSEMQIANPFASGEQIKQKIQDLLSISIENDASSKAGLIEIKCLFGDSLDLFSCSANALID